MNCYLHPETPAVAFCRSCGRALCTLCQRPAEGTVFCQDHVPVTAYANPPNASAASNPYAQPGPPPAVAPIRTSPGLAFALGWIPGVGAIYNGQYLKGLVHVVIFGLLVSLASSAEHTSGQPLLAMMTAGFVFYMPFEAFHTAKKRQMGIPVDEWSSLLTQNTYSGRTPVGPILLILIGVLFLLDTLHILEFRQIGRFWPVILIVVGAYMLYSRISSPASAPPASQPSQSGTERSANHYVEPRHEQ
jgi:TM2 domain-containing membrane protein YozV